MEKKKIRRFHGGLPSSHDREMRYAHLFHSVESMGKVASQASSSFYGERSEKKERRARPHPRRGGESSLHRSILSDDFVEREKKEGEECQFVFPSVVTRRPRTEHSSGRNHRSGTPPRSEGGGRVGPPCIP